MLPGKPTDKHEVNHCEHWRSDFCGFTKYSNCATSKKWSKAVETDQSIGRLFICLFFCWNALPRYKRWTGIWRFLRRLQMFSQDHLMFPRMLMKLVSLRTLSSVHSEQVFALRLQDKKLPPLLSEIWDVNEWLTESLQSCSSASWSCSSASWSLHWQTDRRALSANTDSFLPVGWDVGHGIEIFFIFFVGGEKSCSLLSERLVLLWREDEWTSFCWAFCGDFFFPIDIL